MSIQDKIDNAEPTTWPIEGLSEIEVAVVEERVKWLRAMRKIRRQLKKQCASLDLDIPSEAIKRCAFEQAISMIEDTVRQITHE